MKERERDGETERRRGMSMCGRYRCCDVCALYVCMDRRTGQDKTGSEEREERTYVTYTARDKGIANYCTGQEWKRRGNRPSSYRRKDTRDGAMWSPRQRQRPNSRAPQTGWREARGRPNLETKRAAMRRVLWDAACLAPLTVLRGTQTRTLLTAQALHPQACPSRHKTRLPGTRQASGPAHRAPPQA